MNLFSSIPVAHNCDPETSHEAAEQITASGERERHAAIVLELVRKHPGSTAIELVEAQVGDGLTEYQIRRRLTDLLHAGLVVQGAKRACRVRRSNMVVWSVAGA